MAFNRIVDARWDALNPRTANREIPTGKLTSAQAIAFLVVTSAGFIASTWPLGMVCFALSPVALAIVFWYSLAKRVTSYTQFFLGLAMAVAPVGGWLAAGGSAQQLVSQPWLWPPLWLALAIGTWVGGFDVLYACQDLGFDREHGLRSIPVRFGVARSLLISRGLHVLTIACLVALGLARPLGPVYFGGVAAVALLLFYEQTLVREDDLSQVKKAFDLNGYVGILYLITTGVAVYVR
jgi:4-hydroxybenzoate polyprenyltransferase